MHGAVRREPGTDYEAEASGLIAEIRGQFHAGRAILRRLGRDPRDRYTIVELIHYSQRLTDFEAQVERLREDLGSASAMIELGRSLERVEREGAQRLAPRHRPQHSNTSRSPFRVVPAWVSVPLVGAGAAIWHAMKTHARGYAATGVVAATMTGATTLVVLTPHAMPATVPHTVLVPAAASPVAPAPVIAVHRRKQKHPQVRTPLIPPRVTSTAPPSPSGSPSPVVSPGTLLVSPLRPSHDGIALLTITAEDGRVTWFARASGAVTIDQRSGVLAAGESVTLIVHAAGAGTITIEPGDIIVRVTPGQSP